MEKIKQESVAGLFYPKEKEELENLINSFKPKAQIFNSRAVIVPHAGLIYSGDLALSGINYLDKNLKKLFIFAPCHKVYTKHISLSSFDFWKTPLGQIKSDKKICDELVYEFGANYNDEAFLNEHAIEVQLPLVQKIFSNVEIIPVLIGEESPLIISKIISKYWQNEDVGFIISSDLSHFLDDKKAKETDSKTADMIEENDVSNFSFNMACGAIGVLGLCLFAKNNDFSLIRLGMKNSSDTTGDTSRVVGYGAWALYEGTKNDYIEKYYKDFILSLSKKAISSRFTEEKTTISYDAVFAQKGACFVTIQKEGGLRGCIGSIVAHRSLLEDLFYNAQAAAFNDPRFVPVSAEEVPQIKLAISLLSHPKEIEFSDEYDLIEKIQKDKDGIIIQDKGKRAVYLPSVWEEIQDKRAFLNSLKMKAGFSPDYFSQTFKAFRFSVNYIKE